MPLALTKSVILPSSEATSSLDSPENRCSSPRSPRALDLRCPSFVFNFPTRLPSSAPILQSNVTTDPLRNHSALTTSKKRHSQSLQKTLKRHKVVRKLNFDEHKSSPVSGTFIRDSDSEDDLPPPSSCVRRSGDIDPSLNVVVITDEARAELAKIENKIGDYNCALCKERFADAFGLAQHRCSRIVHVEYRCPECDKVFNCPANLASHRRWHKPRPNANSNGVSKTSKVAVAGTATIHHPDSDALSDCTMISTPSPIGTNNNSNNDANNNTNEGQYECEFCQKKFRRQAYLKKHIVSQHSSKTSNNVSASDSLAYEIASNNNSKTNFSPQTSPNAEKESDNDSVKCPICGLLLPSSSHSLSKHFSKHHPSESRSLMLLQSIR